VYIPTKRESDKSSFMKKTIWLVAGISGILFINLMLFKAYSESEHKHNEVVHHVVASQIPPVYSVYMPANINFAGEAAPMDNFLVREFLDRELTSNTYFHSSTIMLMKRANRWFPVIEPILAEHGIPNDFKYLALIESGLENVVSPAGAVGVWQFLTHTAREYGLEVNSGIDERYNLEKSTHAACRYLRDAFERYNSWTLAAAAYNGGNSRITNALEKQRVHSYYDLFLNQETARYVFRILAIKSIFEQPESYGFMLNKQELFPPVPVKTIVVTETVPSLIDFAIEHNTNYKTLKYFNPWLRQDYLPNNSRRTYHVKIPVEGFTNYSRLMAPEPTGDVQN
jgi:membrane-bound lytic murein transglycosylase D